MVIVFVSYAQEDALFFGSISQQIETIVKNNSLPCIAVKSMQDFGHGCTWPEQVKAGLNEADVGIALLSHHYWASTHSYGCVEELQAMLTRRKRGNFLLIPIILQSTAIPTYLEDSGVQLMFPGKLLNLGNLSASDAAQKPGYGRDAVCQAIARTVCKEITAFRNKEHVEKRDVDRGEYTGGRAAANAWRNRATAYGSRGVTRRHTTQQKLQDELQSWIPKGEFVLCVGPVCSQVDVGTQTAASSHILQRRAAVSQGLTEGEISFLDELIGMRTNTNIGVKTTNPPKPTSRDTVLAPVMRNVLSAARLSLELFGKALATTGSPRAPIPLDARDVRPLIGELGNLSAGLKKLLRDEGLVRDRRIHLLAISRQVERLAQGVAALPSLYLDQAKWLCDLMWYLIRFDAPFFPSRDDLAFQLSVNRMSAPPETPPAGNAWDGLELDDVVDDFCHWMEQYSKQRSGAAAHVAPQHDAMAVALFARRPNATVAHSGGSGAASMIRHFVTPRKPLILSFAPDDLIEVALSRRIETGKSNGHFSFNVIFPVWCVTQDEPREVSWVVETRVFSTEDDNYVGAPRTWNRHTSFLGGEGSFGGSASGDLMIEFQKLHGPIIVKAAGAPYIEKRLLDDLGLRTERYRGTGVEIKHRLMLQESTTNDILDIHDESNGRLIPVAVVDEVNREGARATTACFLGFAMSNGGDRLCVRSLSRALTSNGESHRCSLILCDKPSNPFYHSALDKYGIDQVELSHHQLLEMISDAVPHLS